MNPAGFAHSEIHGSRAMCASPWLIAACHVLRRLPVPRHPPCALTIFFSMVRYIHTLRRLLAAWRSDAIFLKTRKNIVFSHAMQLSRYGGGDPRGPDTARSRAATKPESLSAGNRRARPVGQGKGLSSSRKSILPRKEVIQPHVPVRLPCYDFTPLTLHTFGASLPCGLGRRLRVQTTRVV